MNTRTTIVIVCAAALGLAYMALAPDASARPHSHVKHHGGLKPRSTTTNRKAA
jgi:hypothetical protein